MCQLHRYMVKDERLEILPEWHAMGYSSSKSFQAYVIAAAK
jgi:hypothetical protein